MDKQHSNVDDDSTTNTNDNDNANDNQKRRRSDYENDDDNDKDNNQHSDRNHDDNKKAKIDIDDTNTTTTNTNSSSTNTNSSSISPEYDGMGGDKETIEIAPDKVAHVIGSKGAIIQELQARTGAKIYVNQEFPPGVNRQVLISGSPAQVKTARELVNLIIANGPTAIHENSLGGGPVLEIVIECPQSQVGKMIGPAGTTIKDLQAKSGAKIQIDQDFPDGVPRKIRVSGTQTAVSTATQLISVIMEGPNSAPPSSNSGYGGYNQQRPTGNTGYGGGSGQTIECAKSIVAKVIGKGGETIKSIQARSGAKVQIEQNQDCLLYTSPSPRDRQKSRMPSSA